MMTINSHWRRISLVVCLGACLAALALSAAAPSAAAQEAAVAYRGAQIVTMGKAGTLSNATIVLRDGKIAAVGADTAAPADAEIIDASGWTILPGLVEPYRVIPIAGISTEPQFRTVTFGGRTFRIPIRGSTPTGPYTRIAENFYPYDLDFQPSLRSGLTVAQLVAAGHGQAALARLTPKRPAAMLQEADGPLYATVSNNSTSLDVLRTALAAARGTGSASRSARPSTGASPSGARPSGGSRTGGSPPSGSSSRSRTRGPTGQALEAWKEVVAGKRLLVVNVNNAAAVLHLLKLLEPYREVKLALVGSGGNLYEVRQHLKRRPLTLILQPAIETIPYSQDRMNFARLMHEARVPFVFSLSLGAEMDQSQDCPLQRIAWLVKTGLPRDAALQRLTSGPARLLGIADTHGTLETGKVANLTIFAGDPLDVASRLRQVVIEGSIVYED